MRVPSGDHVGLYSSPSLPVSWRTWVPSAFITNILMSTYPEEAPTKAMRVPSGDHAGIPSQASLSVSWRTWVPSAFITKIS